MTVIEQVQEATGQAREVAQRLARLVIDNKGGDSSVTETDLGYIGGHVSALLSLIERLADAIDGVRQ